MKALRRLGITATLVALTGCPDEPGQSPKATLEAYLEQSLKGDPKQAYALLTAADRGARDLEAFERAEKLPGGPLGARFKEKTSYRIGAVETKGDVAHAEVTITAPDLEGLLGDLFATAFAAALKDDSGEDAADAVADKLAKGEIEMKTTTSRYEVRREGDRWSVFRDYEAQVAKENAVRRARKLFEEAEELRRGKKIEAALERMKEARELDPDLAAAAQRVEELTELVAKKRAAEAYIPNVKLYDVTAKFWRTYSGREPGVEFKLKNEGDRTLDRVEVTVYFHDDSGAVIHEATYNPVLVTEFAFGRDNKPLRPGYVWRHERGRFYKAASVPSEWKVGAVEAKVTAVEFADLR